MHSFFDPFCHPFSKPVAKGSSVPLALLDETTQPPPPENEAMLLETGDSLLLESGDLLLLES